MAKLDPSALLGTRIQATPSGGMWGNRLGASVDSYQANLYGVAEALTGANWAREGRVRNEDDAAYQRDSAARLGAVDNWRDIGGVGDAANWVGGLAVDSLPYIGEAVVGGLVGRGLAVGARAAGSAAGEMGMVAAQRGAARQATTAAAVGGAVASYPSAMGDILSNQREEAGSIDLLSAGTLAVPYAALNAMGVSGAAARGGLARNVSRALDEGVGLRGGLARTGASIGRTAVAEGLSETGQELLNQAGRNAVNSDAGYFGEEALGRYADAFVGGAALGGAFGTAGGWRRSQAYQDEQQDLLAERQAVQLEQEQRAAFAEAAQRRQQALIDRTVFPQGVPQQQFIDQMVRPAPREGKERKAIEAEYAAMMAEPTGGRLADPGTWLERPETVGDTVGLVPAPAAPTAAAPAVTPDAAAPALQPSAQAEVRQAAAPAPVAPEDPTLEVRAKAALGSGAPAKAVELAKKMFALVDQGATTDEEVTDVVNALSNPRSRRYKNAEAFISDVETAAAAKAAAPETDAEYSGAVPPSLAKRFNQVLMRRNVRDRKIILDALGLDADISMLPDGRRTFAAIASEHAPSRGKNAGSAMTEAAVRKIVRSFIKETGGGSLTPTEVSGLAQITNWFDGAAATPPADAALSSDDAGLAPATGEAVEPTAEAVAEPALSAEDGPGERVPFQEESDFDLASEVTARQAAGRQTMRDYFKRAMAEGSVDDVDFNNAEAEFDDGLPEGTKKFSAMATPWQVEWVETFMKREKRSITAKDYSREWSRIQDVANRPEEPRAANPGIAGAPRPGRPDPARNQGQIRGSNPAPGQAGRSAKPAAAPAEVAAPTPSLARKHPDEQWGELAAVTPGMPAWASLNSRQRAQWTDLAYRDQGNLAAAQQIAGSTAGQPENTPPRAISAAGEDPGTLPESQTRLVSRDDMLSAPGARDALEALQRRGLGHVLTWARRFYVSPSAAPDGKKLADGWVTGRAATVNMAVTLNSGMNEVTTRWTLRHEAGHVADMAPYGGVYSADARLQPGGAVIEELRALYDAAAPRSVWREVLAYPLNVKPFFVPSETVAQLFAVYTSPAMSRMLEKAAPKSFRFIEQVIRHVRLQTAPPATTDYDAQVQARRRSFVDQLRAEGRASASAQANPGVPETAGSARQNLGGPSRAVDSSFVARREQQLEDEADQEADAAAAWALSAHSDAALREMVADVLPWYEANRALADKARAVYDVGPGVGRFDMGWTLRQLDLLEDAIREMADGGRNVEAMRTARYVLRDGDHLVEALRDYVRSADEYRAELRRKRSPSAREMLRGLSAALDNVAPLRASKSVGGGSAARAADAAERSMAAAARVERQLPPKARDAWVDLRNFFKRVAPYYLTNFQLAQQYGQKIPELMNYIGFTDLAKQQRVDVQIEFDRVASVWHGLKDKAALDALAQDATLAQTHPDLEFDHELNSHLGDSTDAKLTHAKLKAQYNALSPAAKQVYQDARKALDKSWRERAAAYQGLVDRAYSERIADAMGRGDAARAEELRLEGLEAEKLHRGRLSSMKGPYFPLMRFGEYLTIGESSELLALKDEVAGLSGPARTEAQAKLDKLLRDPAHYRVAAHEKRSAAETAKAEYSAAGLQARTSMGALDLANASDLTKQTVKHLEDSFSKSLSPDLQGPVLDALQKVFLQGLPEVHALHREAQRKGVSGADKDTLRSFAAAGQSHAFHLSRLAYAKDMADALLEIGARTKGDTDLTHVYREMQKRMSLDMTFTETPWQDIASSFTWAYQLGVSPAAIAINATQPFLVTTPVLAGKYGVANATREIARAARDSLMVLKDARFKDGKWDWWAGVSEDAIPGPSRNEDRAAVRLLMRRGILADGAQHELSMFAHDSSRWLSKVNRVMGWATMQVEVSNRLTTGLAAFRLARQDGKSESEAVDLAYEAVQGTQFDYSQEGSARLMRTGGGVPGAKLVFQFRRYQQGLLYLLGNNIKKMLTAPGERKQAAATLAYLAVTTGAVAGISGLPFIGTAFFIANLFRDDDDPEGDAQTWMRNVLYDMTGDRDTATALAKGLPTLFGMDLSKRVGMADVAGLFPYARTEQAKTTRGVVAEIALSAMGPSAGLAANMADGVVLIGSGDVWKGVEKMIPKAGADVLRAARYQTEGMTDRRGAEILGPEEIGAWNTAVRAFGVASAQEANYYEGTSAKTKLKMSVDERKGAIGDRFQVAMRTGDFADVRAQIKEFNARHPAQAIKPKDELRWRQQAVRKAAQRDSTGIAMDPKRDKPYEEIARFAR